MPSGTQPRCVQTPSVISQFFLPGLVRSASVCGSRRSDSLTASASAISFGVRFRMKTGCLRHCALMPCPGWILEMSTSVVASASTSLDGAICTKSGINATTVPTPAKLTAATFRKSRRRTPPSSPVLWEPSADRACVAILTLLTLSVADRMVLSDAAPAQGPKRLAGLIASGFRVDKGPNSDPLPGAGTKPLQQQVEYGRVKDFDEGDAR